MARLKSLRTKVRPLIWLTGLLPVAATAIELHDGAHHTLSLDIDTAYGGFHSERAYAQTALPAGHRSWTEGYFEIAVSGSHDAWQDSHWYGSIGNLSTATWGDGDASGITTGDEQQTDLEDAYIGWKSGTLWPWLGNDGIEVSLGRRNFALGEGFLIDGDVVSYGKGFDDTSLTDFITLGSLDRGGAFSLGQRQAFNRIALLQIGADTAFSGRFFWFSSDNKAQAKTDMAGMDLTYTSAEYGKFALAYLLGLSVDDDWAEILGYSQRDGQDTINLRYDGSALHEALTLKGEAVSQDNGSNGDDWAWYGRFSWKFVNVPATPELGLQYSAFSNGFDPLFYDDSNGHGTWVEGEVAGNYAGPFNSNASIAHLHASVYPSSRWTAGALLYYFKTDDKSQGDLDGSELDLFITWHINNHFSIEPLIGLFKPDKSANEGGSQLGDNDLNFYAHVVVSLNF